MRQSTVSITPPPCSSWRIYPHLVRWASTSPRPVSTSEHLGSPLYADFPSFQAFPSSVARRTRLHLPRQSASDQVERALHAYSDSDTPRAGAPRRSGLSLKHSLTDKLLSRYARVRLAVPSRECAYTERMPRRQTRIDMLRAAGRRVPTEWFIYETLSHR